GARRVDIGGIEEVDAGLPGLAVDWSRLLQPQHPGPFLRYLAEAHAPEADAADFQSGASKANGVHGGGSLRRINDVRRVWRSLGRSRHAVNRGAYGSTALPLSIGSRMFSISAMTDCILSGVPAGGSGVSASWGAPMANAPKVPKKPRMSASTGIRHRHSWPMAITGSRCPKPS